VFCKPAQAESPSDKDPLPNPKFAEVLHLCSPSFLVRDSRTNPVSEQTACQAPAFASKTLLKRKGDTGLQSKYSHEVKVSWAVTVKGEVQGPGPSAQAATSVWLSACKTTFCSAASRQR